jgi:hypothetical protein
MIIKSLFSLFSLTFSISPFEPWHIAIELAVYVDGQILWGQPEFLYEEINNATILSEQTFVFVNTLSLI